MATTYPFARRFNATCIAGLLSLTSGSAFAAGFALIEQSVSSMGTAYAGAGSAAEDASTVFFNPAIMSKLDGRQVSTGLHIVLPETEFSGTAAYNSPPYPAPGPGAGPFPITPSGPDNDTDGGTVGIVPHFTYVQPINDRMNFGLTVNVPFGLATEYGYDWVGRYSAIESDILTVNLNPNLSFKVDDYVTIGIGISAMYANLFLQNAIDDPYLTGGTATVDGIGEIDVDDWGFGWNFGVLLEPTEHTRLGIAYRSKVEVELGGDLTSTSVVQPSTSAAVDASLPDTVLLSAYHEVDPQWAVMADVMWTQWSRLNALVARLGTNSTNTIPVKWEDSFRYSIGASYKHDDKWTLRGGLALDETPTPSPEFRLSALPDGDRTWLTFGAGYKYSKNLSFDFGYAHLFIEDTRINSTDAYSSANNNPLTEGIHRVSGTYDATVDIISAQVNWKM